MRGQYSTKPAPRTMSADMDKWERDQQRKHTAAKRVRRTFRRLGRELAQSPQNTDSEKYDHDEVRCDEMADLDCDNKMVGEPRTCCVCAGHACEVARAERLKHPARISPNTSSDRIPGHKEDSQ